MASELIPGNRDPGRYRKTTLSVVVAGLIAAGAATPVIYRQFLDEVENGPKPRLVAYQDGAHIWTICGGLTHIYGRAVKPSDKLPQQECDRLDALEQASGLKQMQEMVTPAVWAAMSPAARAGTTSFCVHNIGPGKCRASSFLRLLNAGQRNDACAEITKWIRDSGRDCRIRASNCYGQVERRPQEDELCLTGDAP